MANTNIATNYARAFFGIAGTPKAGRALANDLETFATLIDEHAELRVALSSALFSEQQRADVVADLCVKGKAGDLTKKALRILAESGRIGVLRQIADKVRDHALRADNTVPIVVESAVELDEDEQGQVTKRFEKVLGRKVEARFAVAATLLGGVRVRAEGRTYDGSLRGQLDALRERLVGAGGR